MPDDSMFTLQATDASEVTDAASADDAASASEGTDAADAADASEGTDAADADDAASASEGTDAADADDAADAAGADGADDAEYVCGDCGRAFYTEDLRVLHRGVRHPETIDPAAQEAYREAYREEERAIRSFRIRALGVLVVLYFGLLFLYVVYAS
jgi:hypothetical protein